MKKIVIICPGRVTSINLANQLEKIFEEYTEVQPFSIEDELDFDIKNSFVVLSSSLKKVKKFRKMNMKLGEGLDMTEGHIRKLISNAEMLGFAESSKGRKGTNLTEKGLKVLSEAGY